MTINQIEKVYDRYKGKSRIVIEGDKFELK